MEKTPKEKVDSFEFSYLDKMHTFSKMSIVEKGCNNSNKTNVDSLIDLKISNRVINFSAF